MKRWKRAAALAMTVLFLSVAGSAGAAVTLQQVMKGGRVSEAFWQNEQGDVAAGPLGYALIRYSYGKDGTTEQYYSAEGGAYETAGGYCGRLVTYDAKGRVSAIVYLDENGRKTETIRGFSRVRIDYTSFGQVKLVRYYNESGKQITVPSLGYAEVETTFRGKTLTGRTYTNVKGKAVDTELGYAAFTQRVNKKNQVLAVTYTHADGSPATCLDGWSSCEVDLDEEGREARVRYYDENGNLTDRGLPYAWEETVYDSDSMRDITRYDAQGNKTDGGRGYATLRQKLSDDVVLWECFLNAEGQRVLNAEGVGAIRYGYDTDGRLFQMTYEDLNGQTAPCAAGYCGWRDTLNENGTIASRLFLNAEGLPTALEGGYCELRFAYDGAGRVTDTGRYSVDGLRMP